MGRKTIFNKIDNFRGSLIKGCPFLLFKGIF